MIGNNKLTKLKILLIIFIKISNRKMNIDKLFINIKIKVKCQIKIIFNQFLMKVLFRQIRVNNLLYLELEIMQEILEHIEKIQKQREEMVNKICENVYILVF